jgi:O-antigen ligase
MYISVLFSEEQRVSLLDFSLYMKSFLLSIFIYFVIHEDWEIKILSKFILLGGLIGAVVIIYQYATGTLTIISGGTLSRGASLSADPNDTSRLMNLSIPLAVYWIIHSDRRLFQFLNIAAFLCILAGVFLTKSRGGFVTLVFLMGIIFIKNLSLKTTLVAIILLIGAILFGAATGYWDRVGTLTTLKHQKNMSMDGSLESRLDLAKTGILLFKENVFIGAGPGQFGRKYLEYKSKRSLVRDQFPRITPAAHNLYLEFAVENGILGISALFAIFFYSLRGFLQLSRNGPDRSLRELGIYFGISFISILVSGLFLSGGQSKALWLIVGLGFAAYNIKRSYR